MNNLGIIIITYNCPAFLLKQMECLHRFCKDKFEVVIVDNSTEQEAIESILYHSGQLGCKYIKTNASSKNGSGSHSFAANIAYRKFKDDYDYMFFLDHDCMPIKDFSVIDILSNGHIMAGLGQLIEKSGKTYFWPGCVMWNNKEIDKSLIDFSPNAEFGLDTGGGFYKIFDFYGKDKLIFFNEEHCQNPQFTKSFYDFYCLINNGMFFHCVNGSNWSGAASHEERINSLLNIVEGYLH